MSAPFLSLLAGPAGRKLAKLFARLCAAPADDGPRRDIARLFADSQHVARAALITTQLELANIADGDPTRAALVELERRLLAEHAEAWRRAELPQLPGVTWGDFERGFPRAVEIADPDVLIHLGTEIRTAGPIECVRIRNLRLPQLHQLLSTSHLVGLREVDLSGNVVGLAGAQSLRAVPANVGWRRLNLHKTELGPLGLHALSHAPFLAHLEALDVSSNHLRQAGAELAAAVELRELNLADNELIDVPLQGLVGAAALPKLTRLDLHHNQIGDDGVSKIASHRGWTALAALDLRANPLGDAAMLALAEAPFLPPLDTLRLGENRVGKRAMTALLRSPRCAHLRVLGLAKVEPGEEALRHIATLGTLTRLDLAQNDLHAGDLRPLAASPQMARLQALRLHANRLGPAGARLLADSPYLVGLRELDVAHNQLGTRGVAILTERLGQTGPATLALDNNGITAAGALTLAAAPGLAHVRALGLADNPLGDDGCRALANSPHLVRLERLDLTKTGLAAEGAKALLAWPGLARLRELRVTGNAVPGDLLLRLREHCGGVFPLAG
jgi:Ran GTPase-activating protein (RanGAP) involved in mRNA processing and transport